MEFILALILFLIFISPSSNDEKKSSNEVNSHKKHSIFDSRQNDCDSFDPAETFHLEDGLDHDVDFDGYCEECDNYHEQTLL